MLIAAIKHETHVFKRVPTTLEDFRHGLHLAARVPEIFRGTRLELGGFLDVGERLGWQLFHPLAASATPGGRVTDAAFAEFMTILEAGLERARPLDGVLLALHGSMATESFDDAEGEILRRVRRVIGGAVPIGVSLDPHSNVTRAMADNANIIVAYRTNPHTDHFAARIYCAASTRHARIPGAGRWSRPCGVSPIGSDPSRACSPSACIPATPMRIFQRLDPASPSPAPKPIRAISVSPTT